jgi:hypothetical protein
MLKTLLKTALQIPNPSSMIVSLRRLRCEFDSHQAFHNFLLGTVKCIVMLNATLLKTLLKTFGIC